MILDAAEPLEPAALRRGRLSRQGLTGMAHAGGVLFLSMAARQDDVRGHRTERKLPGMETRIINPYDSVYRGRLASRQPKERKAMRSPEAGAGPAHTHYFDGKRRHLRAGRFDTEPQPWEALAHPQGCTRAGPFESGRPKRANVVRRSGR